MEFKKAVKAKQKLRLAIDGVSGSGKTYTALAIATGMAEKIPISEDAVGKVAVIDSEHGSASLYADRFDFQALELEEFQIETYIEALNVAAASKFPVVIIDSTSHAWDALVERVERIATQKFGGNTFRAWGEGTPLQKKLVEAMLNYPGHLIVTCRSKTEYSVDKDEKGKTTVKKVGTAAVQRQGFEYEFTMAMTMDANHVGLVTKDRTSEFQDKFIEKPGKEFGRKLIDWLNKGAEPPPPSASKNVEQQCHDEMVEIGNIMTGVSETGERYFTDDEVKAVKVKILSFPRTPLEYRLNLISKLLDDQKNLLRERMAFFEGTGEEPKSENHPSSNPAKPAETHPSKDQAPAVTPTETPSHPLAMYDVRELDENPESPYGEGNPEADPDDGFVDDIPWKDEPPPKKPFRKTTGRSAGRSLSEEFQNRINKETTAVSGELDIY